MLDESITRFNQASTDLQTEFRSARSPDDWQRLAKTRWQQDYTKLFEAVVPMIKAFVTEDSPSERACVVSKLTPDALGILLTFASSTAVLAVRRKSPELIAQGLIALAIMGDLGDVRDQCFYLAALHHSAMKLGIETSKLFGDVAGLVSSPDLQNEMRKFPLRPHRSRELSAFHMREIFTDQGYDLGQDD
ncbi:MAG: hypothetical protein ABI833_21015 [Acidobacteriota bacterium]